MTSDSNSGGDMGRSPASEPIAPRKPQGSNNKWYAVIIVLIFIAAGFAVLAFYHPAPATGNSASVSSASGIATTGQPYNFNITTNGKFSSMTVYFGDGTSQMIQYSGSTTVPITHVYTNPGQYYIYFVVNYGGSVYNNANNLISVQTTLATPGPEQSFGSLSVVPYPSSTNASVNGTYLYTPGSNIDFLVTYSLAPSNTNYMVVSQTLYEYLNGSVVNTFALPYTFNQAQGAYILPNSQAQINLTKLAEGYYEFGLETTTASLATQTLTTTLLNSTVLHYSPGTYQYNTSQNITLFGGTSTPYQFYGFTYLNGTTVGNSAMTELSFMNGANVTYVTQAPILNYTKGTGAMFAKDVNLTFDSNTNITFASNLTANITGNVTAVYNGVANYTSYSSQRNGTFKLNNTTTYAVTSGSTIKLLSTDTLMFVDNAQVNFSMNTNVVYSAGSAVTDYLLDNVTYHGNTTMTYLNTNAYYVTLGANTNVTLWYEVNGATSQQITAGAINTAAGVYHTTYYQDVAVFANAGLYTAPSSGKIFTNAELVSGGITTLDPSIAYFTVDGEILQNTELTLVTYNQSSTTNFIPLLVKSLPSLDTPSSPNNGINNNTANYNVSVNSAAWGPANSGAPANYTVHLKPYENYTFTISPTAKWQNGQPVTAWDVMTSFTRTLLFDAGAPGTPGWIIAQYLLPGNYYASNTFWNITQNMTVNNATNSITLHFQTPMSPTLVNQLMAAPGTYVADYSWLESVGAGITWNYSGFMSYEAQGSLPGYNTAVQFGDFSDGPYMATYINPSSEVVLTKNPYYTGTPAFPAATIPTVAIKYFAQPSSTYLLFKNGAAQSFQIPTSNWNDVKALQASSAVNITKYSTLGVFFYYFNARVNTTVLSTVDSTANMPSTLFTNLQARQAFADLFNLSNYLGVQVGNNTYHEPFGIPFQGMLPKGMAFAPTLSQILQNVTPANYPGYNVSRAIHIWDNFVNSSVAKNKLYLSRPGGTGPTIYNGSQLAVPFMIPIGDPVDAGMAAVWGAALSTDLGVSLQLVTVTYTQLYVTFAIQGQNPMAINWGGWSPDYPYPSDYMLPMTDPVNGSLYMGANSLTYAWFGNTSNPSHNASEASMMKNMSKWYTTATSNPTLAQQYFVKMDYEFVNMSFTIDTEQQNAFVLTAPSVNQNLVAQYQTNVMLGPTGYLYNYLEMS
ncbi:MAG: ABC transporter substrate-binding protein [Thermoplasmataceae archaeon]